MQLVWISFRSRPVSRPQINKMQWLDLEAFFAEHIPPTPWREPKRKVNHAFDGMPVDFDIVVLICMAAWQRDANAPRLAAISSTFNRASAEAANNVKSIDVIVACMSCHIVCCKLRHDTLRYVLRNRAVSKI